MLREVTLHGSHVLLEPLRAEHAPLLAPALGDPSLWRQVFKAPPGEEELRSWIQDRLKAHAAGRELPFLQRDMPGRRAFGCTALTNIDRENRGMEIGHTWIAPGHRKHPGNTEAKLLLLRHAFETMKALRVQFLVDARNEKAHKALEHIGAVREGLLRNHHVLPDGFVRATVVYSIIQEEWPQVEARLNQLLLAR